MKMIPLILLASMASMGILTRADFFKKIGHEIGHEARKVEHGTEKAGKDVGHEDEKAGESVAGKYHKSVFIKNRLPDQQDIKCQFESKAKFCGKTEAIHHGNSQHGGKGKKMTWHCGGVNICCHHKSDKIDLTCYRQYQACGNPYWKKIKTYYDVGNNDEIVVDWYN